MSSEIPQPRVPDLDKRKGINHGPFRGKADPCYKCSTCETVCPVAGVNSSFPGPKFQGPEQWRFMAEGVPIDSSIDACSNCLRCHASCPQEVSLAEMHNIARGERKRERTFSSKYLRDWLLANYGMLARYGSKAPKLANWMSNNAVIRKLGERLLGITAERDAPRFADRTFRDWWDGRGGAKLSDAENRVAYFHGDYVNYHTPEVGKSLVTVFEALGYEVAVPPQRCSGTPMFANGFLDDAERAARFNVGRLSDLVEEGYDIVATCTSCSLALREEYPMLFDMDGVQTVAEHTFDAIEYLAENENLGNKVDEENPLPEQFSYHAPCHATAQGVDARSIPFLEEASVEVTHLGDDCSGMSGTYGWKTERYEDSMIIGEELFQAMEDAPGENALTECPTCAMQMEHGTDQDVSHPIELLAEAVADGNRD